MDHWTQNTLPNIFDVHQITQEELLRQLLPWKETSRLSLRTLRIWIVLYTTYFQEWFLSVKYKNLYFQESMMVTQCL